ncbi:MAG: ral secretion pathway protein GspL [Variovorax sp.]|nr:ral secretion pathway protein GspL [Variovorax sp.]
MSLLLLIAPLPPAAATDEYGWMRSRDDGETLNTQGQALLSLLPAGAEVALGVPSAALSWHQVTLPQGSLGNAARLRSVLDGLLEDRLLDEPETLHFALEPGARTGVPVWVAACNRPWLRSVVQAVEATGRRIVRIVPEFTPQPPDALPLVFVTGEREAPLLTRCDARGVSSLPLTGAGLALMGDMLADTAVVTAEPAVAETAERLLARRVPLVQAAQRWLQTAGSPWELAQFDLAVNARARAGKKAVSVWRALRYAPEWRAARWGAVFLAASQLIGVNAWAWKERNALDAKRAAVNGILTQTFPSVRLVIDAPLQMAREVAALQQATGEVAPSDFEPMLSVLAGSLPAGRAPTAIDYGNTQLRLRGLGLSASNVASLADALAPRGYSVRTEGDLLLMQAAAPR